VGEEEDGEEYIVELFGLGLSLVSAEIISIISIISVVLDYEWGGGHLILVLLADGKALYHRYVIVHDEMLRVRSVGMIVLLSLLYWPALSLKREYPVMNLL